MMGECVAGDLPRFDGSLRAGVVSVIPSTTPGRRSPSCSSLTRWSPCNLASRSRECHVPIFPIGEGHQAARKTSCVAPPTLTSTRRSSERKGELGQGHRHLHVFQPAQKFLVTCATRISTRGGCRWAEVFVPSRPQLHH